MDEAVKIADKICVMHQGSILQYDTPEELLKNPCNDFVAEFVGKNRIWASPEFIKARDIMIEHPACCGPDLSLRKGLEQMRFAKVDSLMVIDRHRHMQGIIRARDILPANLRNPVTTVGQVMDPHYVHATPADNIVDILSLVDENNVSTVPILDEAGGLCGLITKSSLMTTLSHQYLDNDKTGGNG